MIFNKYYEYGLTIIPIVYRGKNPILSGWSKFCTHPISKKQAEEWDQIYRHCNFGLPLGPANQLVALDIDTDDRKILDLCPVSPLIKKGKKGETRFFKYSKNIKSRKFFKYDIEILAEGNQTIIPPSVHPETGVSYVWLTPDTLENFDIKDLPELDLSFLDQLYQENIHYESKNQGGRNNTLKAIVVAMRMRGESEMRIMDEIYQFDLTKHEPRLFLDSKEGFRASTEEEAKRNALRFINNVTKSIINDIPILSEGSEIDFASVGHQPKNVFKPYPEARGIMLEFQKICTERSNGKQDALSLGGAIALMSVLCANRYRSQVSGFDIWPNLYILNIAYSGFGKETPQRLISELIGFTELSGCAGYKSSTSLVMNLPHQQERLDVIDECSNLLKAMNSNEDYKSDIVETLSLIYSKSSTQFNGTGSVGSGPRFGACYNPCVSLLGSTTPIGFRSNLNRAIAAKGLMPRFLVFFQKEIGEFRRDKVIPSVDYLKSKVDLILKVEKRLDVNYNPIESIMLAGSRPGAESEEVSLGKKYNPYLIPFSRDATDCYLNFYETCFNQAKLDPENYESAFYARFSENVARLSLIDAISLERKCVEVDSVEWAKEVVLTCWNNIREFYELSSGENKNENDLLFILSHIQKNGGIIKKSDLFDKIRKLGPQAKHLIEVLMDSGKIEKLIKKVGPKNKETVFYQIVNVS